MEIDLSLKKYEYYYDCINNQFTKHFSKTEYCGDLLNKFSQFELNDNIVVKLYGIDNTRFFYLKIDFQNETNKTLYFLKI